jgi:hypothetical protein
MLTVADARNEVSEGPLKLDVMVVYEDFGTGLRARRALHQTAQQLAVEADLHVNLWNFGLLGEPLLDADAGDSPSLIQMLRELGTAGRLASMDVFLHFGEL